MKGLGSIISYSIGTNMRILCVCVLSPAIVHNEKQSSFHNGKRELVVVS